MIASVQELHAALHQFGSFLDMLDALRLQAEETQDVALFSHLAKGSLAMLEQRTADLRACLESLPPFLAANPRLQADLRLFACLTEALLAAYKWSAERSQFAFFSNSAPGLILNLRTISAEMVGLSPHQEAA